MYSLIEDYLFLWQLINIRKKFSNRELKLTKFFFNTTNIFPVNVIVREQYIFFFVNNKDFFLAKNFINKLRKLLQNKKVLIIREESSLGRLIFSFFQDTYIHDIQLDHTGGSNKKILKIIFLLNKDRAIAIGNDGTYIKTINFMFEYHIDFKYYDNKVIKIPLEIRCEMVNL